MGLRYLWLLRHLEEVPVNTTISASRVILLIGVLFILLAAFGVQIGPFDLFEMGVGVAFASFLA